MKRTLSRLIFIDLLFILFLSLSGVFSGLLSDLFYLIAFVLPTLVFFFLHKETEEGPFKISASVTPQALNLSVLFAAPTVLVIFALSFLVSVIMGALGISPQSVAEDKNFLYAVILHAIAPAIFEEMLFRYIPISALGNKSPRLAVAYSSVLFALAHCNLFQIPYALFAGVIFAVLDVAAGSVLPSVIIHLINNVLSLIWSRGGEGDAFYIAFICVLVLASILSIVFIFIKRKSLKNDFLPIIEDKSKLIFTNSLGLYTIVTLFCALMALVNSF